VGSVFGGKELSKVNFLDLRVVYQICQGIQRRETNPPLRALAQFLEGLTDPFYPADATTFKVGGVHPGEQGCFDEARTEYG
jgi:hypothetical protein